MGNAQSPQNASLTSTERRHLKEARRLFKKGGVHVDEAGENGLTALMLATRSGHTEVVRYMLKQKANVEATDKYQSTALMIAAQNGHVVAARLLLKRNANVDAANANQWTALMISAQNGHVDAARLLLDRNANADAVNCNQWTALMIATEKGHMAVVELLLDRNVNVDAANINQWTALMIAVKKRNVGIAKLLVDRNASVEAFNDQRETALMLAAGIGDVEITRLLLNRSASVDAEGENQDTALMIAARKGHVAVAMLLLDRAANVNATNVNQCTALLFAAEKGHVDFVTLLLDRNASVDAANTNKFTSLMFAAGNGHVEVASLLLDHDANIDATNENQHTALMLSVYNGQMDAMKLLLNRKANVEVANANQWTALMIAVYYGHVNSARLLLDRGANVHTTNANRRTALMVAISDGHMNVVKLLLDRNAKAEAVDADQRTALMIAVINGHVDVTRLLLDRGANIEAVDSDQCTVLMIAARHGYVNVVRVLLDRNASVDAVNNRMMTALIIAARSGHVGVARQLLQKSSNVDMTDVNGRTALMHAARRGHSIIVHLLLTRRADMNVVDKDGNTPLICAAMQGHFSVVKMLLKNGADVDAYNLLGKTALDYTDKQDRKDIMGVILTMKPNHILNIVPREEPLSSRQTCDVTTGVSPVPLDEVKSLCDTMHEARSLCLHIYSRLLRLSKQLSRVDLINDEGGQKFVASVERFYGVLVHYGNKRTITRIVSSRMIVNECQTLHEELNSLIELCKVDNNEDDLQWKVQFQADHEVLRALLRTTLKHQHLLMNELQDMEAQREALTLMLFEINERAGEYDSEEIQLIDRIFQSVARYSTLGIPSVPSWFIPPHEVAFRDQIGGGGFGSVHRGSWIGTAVAVKSVIFHENFANREMFLKEANIWSSLQHPYIIKLFGACHVGNPFFVCEYASNGNLLDYLDHPENHYKTWKCLYEAALGLWYLHSRKKIVHRDIKGDQILVGQDGVAKLTDFGLSCYESDLPPTSEAHMLGAIRWKAPEYISGESSGSFACDVYSFGITIIEVVTRRIPFGTIPDATITYKVAKKSLELPKQPTELSDSQWELIKRMCATNHFDRIDMEAVVQELKMFAAEEVQRDYESHKRMQESATTKFYFV